MAVIYKNAPCSFFVQPRSLKRRELIIYKIVRDPINCVSKRCCDGDATNLVSSLWFICLFLHTTLFAPTSPSLQPSFRHCALNLVLSLQIHQHFALKPKPQRGKVCATVVLWGRWREGGRDGDTKRQRALACIVQEKSHPSSGCHIKPSWKGCIW